MPYFNVFKKSVRDCDLAARNLTSFLHAYSSGHYWGLSGLLIAAPLYGPWNGARALAGTARASDNWIYGWVAAWLVSAASTFLFNSLRTQSSHVSVWFGSALEPQFGEISNGLTHLNLRSLRPAGTRTRAIPRGYGFNLVSCPNYFFETVAWVAFTGLTLDPACESCSFGERAGV